MNLVAKITGTGTGADLSNPLQRGTVSLKNHLRHQKGFACHSETFQTWQNPVLSYTALIILITNQRSCLIQRKTEGEDGTPQRLTPEDRFQVLQMPDPLTYCSFTYVSLHSLTQGSGADGVSYL